MFRFLWLAMLLQPALAFNVGGALAPPTTAATYPLATRSGAVVADAGIIDSIGGVLQSKEVHDLGIFFAQTVISWGVPATVVGALALLVFKPSGGPNEPPPLPPALAKALGVDGGPKEYLEIEKLNEKLQSFEYSFAKNSLSEASAKRSRGKQEIERQLGAEFQSFGLDTATVEKVYDAAKRYRKAEEQVTKKIELSLMCVAGSRFLSTSGRKNTSRDRTCLVIPMPRYLVSRVADWSPDRLSHTLAHPPQRASHDWPRQKGRQGRDEGRRGASGRSRRY